MYQMKTFKPSTEIQAFLAKRFWMPEL